jgi:7-cyano-7-deazaguanine synthase in queuosine biosynthesis
LPERLVLCGGARRTGTGDALHLALNGRSQNITLKLDDISKRLVRNIPDLLIDLVEIASYVFSADQATSRGGASQSQMGSDWRRSFRFVIPVRNPDHWNSGTVVDSLRDMLSFLSDDNYCFEFVRSSTPVSFEAYLEFSADKTTSFRASEVVLLSGGLDSLAGVIEELSEGVDTIALVSHRSSPKIFDRQKQLVSDIRQRFPKRVLHIPVLVTRREQLRIPEHTQRSRSFLYAALACVVARLFEITKVRFFENGVVSVNLPIAQQVVGARATRTTHPLAMEYFREFFSAALGRPIDLQNPFIWQTKADVVRSLVKRNCGSLIRNTISCTRTYNVTKLHTHCGCCSQCIDRRFAVLAADADQHDPVEMYKTELLTGERNDPNDQTMAEAYVRTALELRQMGDFAFFANFGGEASRVCAGYPALKTDDVARLVLDLHQRHGHDVWRVLNNAIAAHSTALIARNLPATSILMMTVAPGLTPSLATVERQKDVMREPLEEVDEPASGSPAIGSGRRRGKPPLKLEAVKRAMKRDLESGRRTSEGLRTMLEKNLSDAYSVSRDTARKARAAVLSEFVEK